MILTDAQRIADEVRAALTPYCDRCEIAGSIRRRCPEVGDVEIVCIRAPRSLWRFVQAVECWPAVKGKPSGRYTQRRLPGGATLDLFMATPETWGLILAVRTGSARFSHEVLARGWCEAGYVSRGGTLRHRGGWCGLAEDGPPVPVREEADLFRLIGVRWVAPWERT